MTDVLLILLAVILVIAVPFDWYAAVKLIAEARRPPSIATLNLAALRSLAIAVAATCFGVLGVSSIVFVTTGTRILPTPVPTILIAIGALVISLPNVYFLRLLEQWKREVRRFHVHSRQADNRVVPHRRHDDPPIDGTDES